MNENNILIRAMKNSVIKMRKQEYEYIKQLQKVFKDKIFKINCSCYSGDKDYRGRLCMLKPQNFSICSVNSIDLWCEVMIYNHNTHDFGMSYQPYLIYTEENFPLWDGKEQNK